MQFLQPKTIAPPASNFSHGVVLPAGGQRLLISGQTGIKPDGSIVEGLQEQLNQCWHNIFAILEEAGMSKENLVKIVVYSTDPDATAINRQTRDRMLGGHKPASTYVVVRQLVNPALLIEIEAEAYAPA